jgi:ABC-type multidrug transport system fused ATPase/permease subunit
MQHSALQRARRHGASPGAVSSIILLGVGSALLTPVLVVGLGLISQVLVGREVSNYLGLRPWFSGGWPFYGNDEFFLLVLVVFGLALAGLEVALLVLLQRAVQNAALRGASSLRSAIHQQTFRLGPHELLDVAQSRPEELFGDKAEVVREGLVGWWQAVPRSIVSLSCLLALAVAMNPWLTLLSVLVAIYSLRVYGGMKSRSMIHTTRYRESAGMLREALLRTLTLAPLRVGYELEEPSKESFDKQLRPFEDAELRANMGEARLGPMLCLIALIAAAFLLLIAGLADDFRVATSVLLGSALLCAFFPARRLFRLPTTLGPAEAAAEEIFAFLDRQPNVHESPDALRLDRLQSQLALDEVTLASRDGRQLLEQVSFNIPGRSCVALLGSDRQTPIALAGLLLRFYDPAAGRILFDGNDIRQATLDTLRGQALLVPGGGLVFGGSVTENVICGNNGFTSLQVTDALKVARAFDFVAELPNGLSTQLSAFDSSLTPHQAFRLGLARALVREPSLLVIQEPDAEWSAEDSQLHAEAMQDICSNRTVIVIPTRIDTLRAADAIYLFHQGKLHDHGTHADLLHRSELYRHMIYVRFNAFRDEVEW